MLFSTIHDYEANERASERAKLAPCFNFLVIFYVIALHYDTSRLAAFSFLDKEGVRSRAIHEYLGEGGFMIPEEMPETFISSTCSI